MKKTVLILTAVMMTVMMIVPAFADTSKEEMLEQAAQSMLNDRLNGNTSRTLPQNTQDINSILGGGSLPERQTGHSITIDRETGVNELQLSEQMRGQIRGLDQASTNAQDGISMVQTAEGALNETTAILQRMRELTVQAANDEAADPETQQRSHEAEVAEMMRELEELDAQMRAAEGFEPELDFEEPHPELRNIEFGPARPGVNIQSGADRIAQAANHDLTPLKR